MSKRKAVIGNLPQTSPDDEHNRNLVANVHPPDWMNPKPAEGRDIVVVGGSSDQLLPYEEISCKAIVSNVKAA